MEIYWRMNGVPVHARPADSWWSSRFDDLKQRPPEMQYFMAPDNGSGVEKRWGPCNSHPRAEIWNGMNPLGPAYVVQPVLGRNTGG